MTFLLSIKWTSYVASRIYLHNPPGENNAGTTAPNAPQAVLDRERELEEGTPEVNPWFCIVFLIITIAIMSVTAEMVQWTFPISIINSVYLLQRHTHS